MTPADRAALLSWAKSRAIPVTSCVTARLRLDHLLGDASREQLQALVVVLAEAADPGILRAVVFASDDGPGVTSRDVMLRAAHSEYERLRKGRQDIPRGIARLESEYKAGLGRQRRGRAA